MKMRKAMSVLLAMAMLSGLTACGSTGATGTAGTDSSSAGGTDQTYTISLATCWANDHPTTKAIDEVFIPYITEHTDGKVVIEHYPNNQLGGEQDAYEQVMDGSVQMAALGNLWGNNVVPELNIQEIPFLFDSEDEFWDVASDINGEFCQTAQKACNEHGVTLLGLYKRGFRETTSNKPINSVEDLNGLVMRMPSVDFIINTWQSYGANTTVIAWNECYTACQQKTCEGTEGSLDSIYAMKLYEVQKDLAMTNHVLSIGELTVNTNYWNTLPKDYQDVISEATKLLQEDVYERITNSEKEWIADMEANGMTVTYPDRESMKNACKDVVKEYIENTDCAVDIIKMFGKTDYLDNLGIAY